MTTPFAVKLDEDLSPLVAEPVRKAGYQVATVMEQGWGGYRDEVLWPLVKAEGRFFITADKGFGDLRSYPPGTHPGILVLRADRESIVEYRNLLESVVSRHPLETLRGTVTIATPRGVRIRRSSLR